MRNIPNMINGRFLIEWSEVETGQCCMIECNVVKDAIKLKK